MSRVADRARSRWLPSAVAVALLAVWLVALAGCTADRPVTPLPSSPATPAGSSGPSGASTADSPTGADSPTDAAASAAGWSIGCPSADGAVLPSGLPAVTLPCLDGGRDVELARLRGPLVVNVWGTWCGPCRAEAPFLAEVSEQGAGKVTFLGVDYDDEAAAQTVAAFAAAAGWHYPQVLDRTMLLRSRLPVVGTPMTVLVRADGSVAQVHPGAWQSAAALRQAIDDELGVRL